MTGRNRLLVVAGFGALTAVVLAAGWGTVGGVMAVVQLCLLVGAPIALLVGDDLRSRSAVFVLSAVLSLAISAIAVQSLVWFELASAELIVVLATLYGIVLGQLLAATATSRRGGDAEGSSGW